MLGSTPWAMVFGLLGAIAAAAGFVAFVVMVWLDRRSGAKAKRGAEIAYIEEDIVFTVRGRFAAWVMALFNIGMLLGLGSIGPTIMQEIEATLIWIGLNMLLAFLVANGRRRRYSARRSLDV